MNLQDLQKNISLSKHTSWMVGGPAEYFAEPKSTEELKQIQKLANKENINLTILGGGTNVLINDQGIKGIVVSLAKLTGIVIVDEMKTLSFWALAGTPKSELLKLFLKKRLAPAAFLAGLPGQTGGGVVMNAGVGEKLTPKEFCEITEAVEVLRPDGSIESVKNLKWDYRHCTGWQPGIITRVLISWPNTQEEGILEKVKELNKIRTLRQPVEWPSCGSVFRNPLPKTAGQLIESVGLKGFSHGGAQISEKHANFIINKGNATAEDIKNLIEHCQEKVKEQHKVDLKTEVVFLK